ncbi:MULTISPECIES: phosphatase PAP2 family protein [Rhodomicrobium]|uniref:phosphatase PAP2 family protein n=1 Tax=Rhodomicrobium TaxID=1068 RepID=UPI000B4AEDF5|nr:MULTISPECIES: phosphatase PAP2 family protein [Rhodomicrobium]
MSMVPTNPQASPITEHAAYSMLCIAASVGLAAAIIFSAFPGIDLAVSKIFYLGDNKFWFSRPSAGEVVRNLVRGLFFLACAGAIAGFIAMAFFSRKLMGLGLAAWAYVALCILVGPGLTTNLFKDHWDRARPVQIVEFGGQKKFTPPLLRTDQCERNCSFFSGEASNIFMLGFAIALLAEAGRRRRLFLAAIAAGSFAGLLRIGAGGHFLSDIVFAGVFMAIVARGMAWLVFEHFNEHLADEGPFHQRTVTLGRLATARGRSVWDAVRQRFEGRQD